MKNINAFVHIEKAAGTSVIHMLRDTFSPAYADVRPVAGEDYWFKSSDLDWYLKAMPWLRIIGGHAVVPYSGLEERYKVKYFTVFRDPVNRYISQYRYWRSALGRNITFEQFMEISDSWNMQTKKIARDRKAISAIQTLQDKFSVYGLVEYMDLFVYELSEFFQCEMYQHRRNLTKNTADRTDELKGKYLQDIINRNQEDIELYNWVKTGIESRIHNFDFNIKEQQSYTHRMLFDYALRKSYYEPISGIKRTLNGLPYYGSYGL